MGVLILLVTCGIATVLGQANHATNSFAYHGCSSIDLACFSTSVELKGSTLTPETCQKACQGHKFAALLPTACRCGDDEKAIKPLDENVCNHPCAGDLSYGACGSVCPAEGPGIANVYVKTEAAPEQPQVPTVHTTSTLSLSATPSTSGPRTVDDDAPLTDQSVNSITLAGPASGAPTTLVSVVQSSCSEGSEGPEGSVASVASGPAASPPAPSDTSCTEEESHTSEQPTTATPSTPTTTTAGDQEPSAYPATSSSPAELTPYQSAGQSTIVATSSYTSSSPSASLQQTASDGYVSGQDVSDVADSTSNPTSEPTSGGAVFSSESLLWPRPSGSASPAGLPTGPAQVPGSDSTHSIVPPLATIGGLALIAAIIM